MSECGQDQTPLLREFQERGFIVVPNALMAEQVAAFNRGVDQYLKEFPEEWIHFRGEPTQPGEYPFR